MAGADESEEVEDLIEREMVRNTINQMERENR